MADSTPSIADNTGSIADKEHPIADSLLQVAYWLRKVVELTYEINKKSKKMNCAF